MKKVIVMGFLGMIAFGIMSSCSKDDEPAYYEEDYGEGGYGDPSTPGSASLNEDSLVYFHDSYWLEKR